MQAQAAGQHGRYHQQGRNVLAADVAAHGQLGRGRRPTPPGEAQGRVILLFNIVHVSPEHAQRLYQHADWPLLHAGRAGEGTAPAGHGQVGGQEAHDGAGVFGVEQVGADGLVQQALHEHGIVGFGEVGEGAAAGQTLEQQGAVGFALGGRQVGRAAKRAARPAQVLSGHKEK